MNEKQFFDVMLVYEGNLQQLNIRINYPNGNSKMIDTSNSNLDYSTSESYFKGIFETEAVQSPETEFWKDGDGLPSVEASTVEAVSFDKIDQKSNRVYCFIELGVKATGIGNLRLDLIFASKKLDNPERFESLLLQKINEDG